MALIQEKAETWKDIVYKNCLLMTQAYEMESDENSALRKRYAQVQAQYQKVSVDE